jgi:hypothetical protein
MVRLANRTRLYAGLLGASLLAACGDDDGPAGLPPEQNEDAGSRVDAAAPSEGDGSTELDGGVSERDAATVEPSVPPRFALATQVFQGSVATSYVLMVDSPEAGDVSAEGQGIELAGRAIVASPGKSGAFFVGTSEGPEVTRYTLDEDGEPVKGPSVSFLEQGVSAIGEYQTQFQFISDDKAYYFDGRTAQVIVWNPSAMTVTGAIDLGELVVAGQLVAFSSSPTRRGDDVIMPVGFRSSDNARIVGGAAAVIVHTGDDSVEIARDDRCGYVRDAVTLDDGTVYVATEAYGSAVRRIASENAPAPCLLRIEPDADAFDPDFYVDLEELAGGAAGSLARTPDGSAYVHVLDESAATITPTTNARVLASSAAWSWSEITLGDEPTLSPAAGLPLMAGSIISFPVSDQLFVAEFVNFNESTKLRDLTDPRGAVALTVPGTLFSLTQVR